MERTEIIEKALKDASRNAQNAFDAVSSVEFAHVADEEKTAWAMAALIHCDVIRLVVAFEKCEREGVARLLWMSDIVSKLHEAKRWYFEKGSPLLQKIAENKACGLEPVRKKLKEIRTKHPIGKVEEYRDYRNKFGYHYDADALTYLNKFGKEAAEPFYDLLKQFVLFSGEWAQLSSSLIKNQLPTKLALQ